MLKNSQNLHLNCKTGILTKDQRGMQTKREEFAFLNYVKILKIGPFNFQVLWHFRWEPQYILIGQLALIAFAK